MKKTIIAGAAASVLAAMPIAGVFAVGQNTFTDTVKVTLAGTCTVISGTAASEGTYTRELTDVITAGNSVTLGNASTAPKMSVSCNTTTGKWTLSAQGDGTGSDKTAMTIDEGSDTIATNKDAAGDNSGWSFMINTIESGATISGNYGSWSNIPASSTPVVTGDATDAKSSMVQIAPSYKVYVKPNQTAGTYTGAVKYTLAYSAS